MRCVSVNARARRGSALRILALVAAVAVLFGCEAGAQLSEAGEVSVELHGTPSPFGALLAFPQAEVPVGSHISRIVGVRNSSVLGVLTVHALELEVSGDAAKVFAIEPPDLPTTIQPGGVLEIPVRFTRYQPDVSMYTATLNVSSDSREDVDRVVAVRLGVDGAWPTGTGPGTLDFGLVRPGDEKTLPAKVANTGSVALRLESAAWSGDLAFDLSDPLPLVIEPGKTHSLRLVCRPPGSGPLETTVLFDTNEAPGSPALQVVLSANARIPRIEVDPLALGRQSSEAEAGVVVRSVGELPLIVNGAEIVPADGAFELAAGPTEASPLEIGKDKTSDTDVRVRFVPERAPPNTPVAATLRLRANTMAEWTEAPLSATRYAPGRPTAVIGMGTAAPVPGATLTASGSDSYNVNGAVIVEWRWEVSGPGASTLTADGPSLEIPEARLGPYTLSLHVTDEDGAVSAPTEELVVVGYPDRLWVELVWTNYPSLDVDLHLAQLSATGEPLWFCPSYDAWADNAPHDWGAEAQTSDDPTVVLGELPALPLTGAQNGGPERVHVHQPQDGQYAIGVYQHGPLAGELSDFGDVWLRVGTEASLLEGGEVTATVPWAQDRTAGQMWFAATVTVSSGVVTSAAPQLPHSEFTRRGVLCVEL